MDGHTHNPFYISSLPKIMDILSCYSSCTSNYHLMPPLKFHELPSFVSFFLMYLLFPKDLLIKQPKRKVTKKYYFYFSLIHSYSWKLIPYFILLRRCQEIFMQIHSTREVSNTEVAGNLWGISLKIITDLLNHMSNRHDSTT